MKNILRSIDTDWEVEHIHLPYFDGYGYLSWVVDEQINRVYIYGDKQQNSLYNKHRTYLNSKDILNLHYGNGKYCMVYDSFDKNNLSFWEITNNIMINSSAFWMKNDYFCFSPDSNTDYSQTIRDKKTDSIYIRTGEHYFDITRDFVNIATGSENIPIKEYDYYYNLIRDGFKMFTDMIMKNILRSIDADWEEDETIIVESIQMFPESSNSVSFECYVNGRFKRYLFNGETSVYHHDYGVLNGIVRGKRHQNFKIDYIELFYQDGKLHCEDGPAVISVESNYAVFHFYKRGKPWLVIHGDGKYRFNCMITMWENLENYRHMILGNLFSVLGDYEKYKS